MVFALVLLIAALTLAACGGAAPGAAEGTQQPATTPLPSATTPPLPTNPPVPTATLAQGGASGETEPERNEFGIPLSLTGYELVAARTGEAVYSGYACVISPVGCACEQPVLERITFTFPEDNVAEYHFAGDGYATTWTLEREGPNQWGYTQNFGMEGTDLTVSQFMLLTFTESGFIRTEGARLSDNSLVACPDVYFNRLALPGEVTVEPTP